MAPPSTRRTSSGAPLALLAYVLWGLLTLYWKAVGDFNPVDLIGWRIVASIAVLAAVCAARGALPAVAQTLRDPRSLPLVAATRSEEHTSEL